MSEFDMNVMDATGESYEKMLGALSRLKVVFPRALVKKIYDGPPAEDAPIDVKELRPGQILVNTKGEWVSKAAGSRDVPAWLVMPYGTRPQTQEDQQSPNRIDHPLNQFFGFFGMPRIGDTVFLIGMARGSEDIATEFFVLGSVYSADVNVPPLADQEDLQLIHRSGSSIRLNDTYVGGGAVSASSEGEGMIKGLTGNLTLTGNRLMMLSGSKYLPHGLLAKYGDPRERFGKAKIDTFDGSVGGNAYSDVFSNNAAEDTFFDPFVDTTMSGKVFLSPPSTDDSIIPLTDNTMLIAQHGGGVFRIDDHNSSTGYSRMSMSATSMSLFVGEEYRQLGLGGISTGFDSPAAGIGEGEAGYGPVGTGSNTFELQHKSGTRITIDEDGAIYITTQDPNANIMIDTADDAATIDMGLANKAAVKDYDETTNDQAQAALSGPPGTHLGFLGIPHGHAHKGHTHNIVATQEKVFI
jgi:hypothetical protein